MGYDSKAKDWEFASILAAGVSEGLAAGGWLFSFRATSIGYMEDYIFLGGGLGTPGVNVEVSLPAFTEGDLSWSRLKVAQKDGFSPRQLNFAPGAIGTAGVSAFGVGYSRLYAEAGSYVDAEIRSGRRDGTLFSRSLNDGLGVVAEKEKLGKSLLNGFKAPKVSVGAVGVMGIWVGVGTWIRTALATTVVIGINVLGAGLVQAGEALLTGRGLAVLYKFANGYASMLSVLTSADDEIPQTTYNTHHAMDWKSRLKDYGTIYIENGSEASNVLSAVEQAGEAAILQAVMQFGTNKGGRAWNEQKKLHRIRYGVVDEFRRKSYLDVLYKQIDKGESIGIYLG